MFIQSLLTIRIVSTLLLLTVSSAFNWAIGMTSFTIPYVLAAFFSDTIAKTKALGLLIIGCFLIYVLLMLITPFLLRAKNKIVTASGLVTAIVLSASDLVCCLLSMSETPAADKVINLLFSACIIIFAACQLRPQLA